MKKILFSICFIFLAVFAFSQNGVENVIVEKYYISDAADASAFGLPVGSTTFRVWVDLASGWKLNSVYGSSDHNLSYRTSSTFFNSPSFDKTIGNQINASKLNQSATMIDSWITFGGAASGKLAVRKSDDTTGSYVNAYAYLQNADPMAGTAIKISDGIVTSAVPATATIGLTNELDALDGTITPAGNQVMITGGAYFVLGGTTGYGANNMVLVGQFTTDGYFDFELNLSVQNTTSGAQENWVWNTPTPGASITEYTAPFMHFYANHLPTVSITAPTNGTTYTVGDVVNISADAVDSDGTVDSVGFFVNGIYVGHDVTPPSPFTFSWTSTGTGAKILTAKAYDNNGGFTVSNPVNIQLGANIPPTVSITTPSEGSAHSSTGGNISINTVATDAAGGIVTNIKLFIDGILAGNSSVSPYVYSYVPVIGNHTLIARAFDNSGDSTTSNPVHFSVYNGNASYAILDQTRYCTDNSMCMTINRLPANPLSDCIGFDIDLNYDNTKVIPTGNITLLSGMITNPLFNASYTTNIISSEHRMLISVFLNPSAPVGTSWHGTGDLCCVEFNKTSGFGATDTAIFSVNAFQESYYNGVNNTIVVQPGSYHSAVNHNFTGNLEFWNGDQPIVYNASLPSQHLITTIWPNPSATPNTPDLTGSFTFNNTYGNSIGIHRDILGSTDVMPVINGQDAWLTKKVLTDDLSFIPSVFQIIAMDVNQDGVISSGDLSQINQRTIHKIQEFKQTWNYSSNGNPLPGYKPSFDWVWINSTQLDQPAFNISSSYPLNDSYGYSKYHVPVIDSLKPLQVSAGECPSILNATFKGVLLGDVNGNYKDIPADGMIKGSSVINDDVVVLHEKDAINGIVEIPVSVNTTGEIHAVDFSLTFNNKDFTFTGIENLFNGLQTDAYVAAIDNTLRVTSFNNSPCPDKMSLLKLKFENKTNQGKLDLLGTSAYTNGERSKMNFIGVNEVGNIIINIYPNPANNFFVVETNTDASLQLTDICGNSVCNDYHLTAGQPEFINTETLSNGLYFLKLYDGKNTSVKKIVITR